MRCSLRKFQSLGFTLLELIIAMGLLAIITAIAVPPFTDFTERQAIRSDIQRFTKLLTTARSIAMTTNDAASVVCWNETNQNDTIQDVPVPAQTMVAYAGTRTSLGQLESTQSLSPDQSFYLASETDGCIGFDSQGRLTEVSTGTPPISFLVCRSEENDEDAIRIEIAATGRVIERPNTSNRGAGVQACKTPSP